jgi:hypothetical protein
VTALERHDFKVIGTHPLRLRSGAHTSRVAAHHYQPLGHTASLRPYPGLGADENFGQAVLTPADAIAAAARLGG